MKITLTNGERPSWLKDDDLVLERFYTKHSGMNPGGRYNNAAHADGRAQDYPFGTAFSWSPDLEAIEIEDTHPYAVATSKGFKFNDGTSLGAPEDYDGTVLFANGLVDDGDNTDWYWGWEKPAYYAIIGYKPKPTLKLETYDVRVDAQQFQVKAYSQTQAYALAEEQIDIDIARITKLDPVAEMIARFNEHAKFPIHPDSITADAIRFALENQHV